MNVLRGFKCSSCFLLSFTSTLMLSVLLVTGPGCGSEEDGDAQDDSNASNIYLTGTRYYDIMFPTSSYDGSENYSFAPDMMMLTYSGDRATGLAFIDRFGGSASLDGTVDLSAEVINLTETFSGGRSLPCTVALFSGGGGPQNIAITDGESVVEAFVSVKTPVTGLASDYGVTDTESGAVVVQNNSGGFSLITVHLRGAPDGFDRQLGEVARGRSVVCRVPPGLYYLEVRYHAQQGSWLYEGNLYDYDGVAIGAGGAAVYEVHGGSYDGSVTYDRPEMSLR